MTNLAGVYWLIDAFGGIAYIGQTTNWPRRRSEHEHLHDLGLSEYFGLARWGFHPVTNPTARSRLEQSMIAQHRPALNRTRGGETGRPTK